MNEEKRFLWLTSHTSSQFYALHGWHDYNYHQSILEMLMQEMHKQSITYQEEWNASFMVFHGKYQSSFYKLRSIYVRINDWQNHSQG